MKKHTEEKKIVANIKEIGLLFNVCLNSDVKSKMDDIQNKKLYDFITFTTDDDIFIYDITNGLDYSNHPDKRIAIIEGLTDISILYENNNDFQTGIELGPMKTITLYKKASLINRFNGMEVESKEDIIEFKDVYDNSFFVCYHKNKIYLRNNQYELNKFRKNIIIFENGKSNNINKKIF